MRARAALCAALVALAAEFASSSCATDIETRRLEYADGELAFTLYTEQPGKQLHLSCYAIRNQTVVQKTASEFQRAHVGVASHDPDEDEWSRNGENHYPCGGITPSSASQSSWGSVHLEVNQINGAWVGADAPAQSITASEPTCKKDDAHWYYDGGIQITQVANDL